MVFHSTLGDVLTRKTRAGAFLRPDFDHGSQAIVMWISPAQGLGLEANPKHSKNLQHAIHITQQDTKPLQHHHRPLFYTYNAQHHTS